MLRWRVLQSDIRGKVDPAIKKFMSNKTFKIKIEQRKRNVNLLKRPKYLRFFTNFSSLGTIIKQTNSTTMKHGLKHVLNHAPKTSCLVII